MTPILKCCRNLALATAMLAASTGHAQNFQPESLGQVDRLPATYPDHWLVIHDATFFHMREGRVLFVDPDADNVGGQFRGMVSANFMAHYEQGSSRGEHYVIETFFSRGGRGGDRTDVVTIYDAASLDVEGEIVIPPRKVSSMPEIFGTALIAGERLLVVYNFSPGQSITVYVDLEKREFVAEYPISGCALVIPTGASGVTSLCSDGALLTTVLTAGGELAGSHRTDPVHGCRRPHVREGRHRRRHRLFPDFPGQRRSRRPERRGCRAGRGLVTGHRRGTGSRLAPRRLATGGGGQRRPLLRADAPGRRGRQPQERRRRGLGFSMRPRGKRTARHSIAELGCFPSPSATPSGRCCW